MAWFECFSSLEGVHEDASEGAKSVELLRSALDAKVMVNDDAFTTIILHCMVYSYADTSSTDEFLLMLQDIGVSEEKNLVIMQKLIDCLWLLGSLTENNTLVFTNMCYFLNRLVALQLLVKDSSLLSTLDVSILTGAGLLGTSIADEKRINSKLIKLNTNAVYRQQKYNRLEEEKEGYSKLVILCSNLPNYPENIDDDVGHFLAIIGQLDLDPNRVLDIILVAFESNSSNRSYIELLDRLHYSSAYIIQVIGFRFTQFYDDRVVVSTSSASTVEMEVVVNNSTKSAADVDDDENQKNDSKKMKYVDLLSSSCNRSTPAELYGVLAMLLCSDILTLESILPYFQSSLSDLEAIFKLKLASKKEKVKSVPTVSMGASATATAASDDYTGFGGGGGGGGGGGDVGGDDNIDVQLLSHATTESGDDSLEYIIPSWAAVDEDAVDYANGNQIVGLFCALVEIRCWGLANVLFKMLQERGIDFMDIPSAYHAQAKFVDWMITDVYALVSSYESYGLSAITNATATASGFTKSSGEVAFVRDIPTLLKHQSTKLQGIQNSLHDFPILVEDILLPLGHHLARFPILFQKCCRLLKKHVEIIAQKNCSSDQQSIEKVMLLYAPCLKMISCVFLPALTCSQSANNPNYLLSRQLWDVLSLFPYEIRFELYHQWYGGGIGKFGLSSTGSSGGSGGSFGNSINAKHVDCCHAEMIAIQNVRALLKRMTAENAKLIGRKLAIFLPTCPLVVFDYLIKHVCAYENLVPIAVEAVKYSSELGFDCLAYSILMKLRNSEKNNEIKIQEGETNVEQWFANLSKFIATFYKKYPVVELTGIFDYILIQINAGKSIDLLLLKDLLNIMGGCDSMIHVSQEQLEGLSGGDILRTEVMQSQSSSGSFSDMFKLSASKKALRNSLLKSGALFPFLLALAKIKNHILFADTAGDNDYGGVKNVAIKLVSHLHDCSQDILIQYTDFIMEESIDKLEVIAAAFPTFVELIETYQLDISIAFQLSRRFMREALLFGTNPDDCTLAWLHPWHPFEKRNALCVTNRRSFSFYTYECYSLFWIYSLCDLHTSSARYEQETRRLVKQRDDIEKQSLSKSSASALRNMKDMIKKLSKTIIMLQKEQTAQEKRVEMSRDVLKEMVASRFFEASNQSESYQLVQALLQDCFIPRMSLSPVDAMYSIHFFKLLHDYEAPMLSTFLLASHIVSIVPALVYHTTEGEAACYGYGLNSILGIINKWFTSHAIYVRDAGSTSGFLVNGCGTGLTTTTTPTDNSYAESSSLSKRVDVGVEFGVFGGADVEDKSARRPRSYTIDDEDGARHYSYFFFRSWCYSWHAHLAKVLKDCLQSTEYISIRCALVFLNKIADQFPVWSTGGNELLACLSHLVKTEVKRNDLKLMSSSLSAILSRRMQFWLKDDGSPVGSTKNVATQRAHVTMKPTQTSNISNDKDISDSKSVATIFSADGDEGNEDVAIKQKLLEKQTRDLILANKKSKVAQMNPSSQAPKAQASTLAGSSGKGPVQEKTEFSRNHDQRQRNYDDDQSRGQVSRRRDDSNGRGRSDDLGDMSSGRAKGQGSQSMSYQDGRRNRQDSGGYDDRYRRDYRDERHARNDDRGTRSFRGDAPRNDPRGFNNSSGSNHRRNCSSDFKGNDGGSADNRGSGSSGKDYKVGNQSEFTQGSRSGQVSESGRGSSGSRQGQHQHIECKPNSGNPTGSGDQPSKRQRR